MLLAAGNLPAFGCGGGGGGGPLLRPNEQHCHARQEDAVETEPTLDQKQPAQPPPAKVFSIIGKPFPRRRRTGGPPTQSLTAPVPPKHQRELPSSKRSFLRDGLFVSLMRLKAFPPRFVFRKALTASDLRKGQNRLQIPRQEYSARFLRARVLTGDENRQVLGGGLSVTALDWKGASYELTLVYLKTISAYRVREKWSSFLEAHGLREPDNVGDFVELWAFRTPEWGYRLSFVLFHRDKAGEAAVEVKKPEEANGVVSRREWEKVVAAAAAAGEDGLTGPEVCAALALRDLREA